MNFEEAFNPVRALQSAWELVKQAPVPMLLGGIILLITGDGSDGNGAANFDWEDSSHRSMDELMPYVLGIMGVACCIGLVFFLISSWVYVGFANTIEKVMRTGAATAGDVFNAKDRWVAMIVTRLFVGVIWILVILPLGLTIGLPVWAVEEGVIDSFVGVMIGGMATLVYLPVMFYVMLGFALAKQACALEGLAAGASLQRSWSLASGHRITLLVFCIVNAIVTVLGFCLCCVGVFFTGALATIAPFESYLTFTRAAERDQWWITTRNTGANAPIDWSSTPPAGV